MELKSLPIKLASFLLPIFSLSSYAQTEQEWWFDVEIILFKRDIAPSQVEEAFSQVFELIDTSNAIDLFSPYLKPDLSHLRDALPYCKQKTAPKYVLANSIFESKTAILNWQQKDPEWQAWLNEPFSIEDYEQHQLGAQASTQSQFDDYVIIGRQRFIDQASEPSDQVVIGSVMTETDDLIDESGPSVIEQVYQSQIDFTFEQIKQDWGMPENMACVYQSEQLALVSPLDELKDNTAYPSMPLRTNGIDYGQLDTAHLLPTSAYQLNAVFKQIERLKGVKPIFHTAWRQPVEFGRSKAATFRLMAGKNFAEDFSATGQKRLALPIEEYMPAELDKDKLFERQNTRKDIAIFDQIEQAISDTSILPAEVWLDSQSSEDDNTHIKHSELTQLYELDGLFKVYLQYIGGVPYLHIDSTLDLRVPIRADNPPISQDAQLSHFRFSQLRRIISRQVHYFDHPMFGMVVELNRYRRVIKVQQSDEE